MKQCSRYQWVLGMTTWVLGMITIVVAFAVCLPLYYFRVLLRQTSSFCWVGGIIVVVCLLIILFILVAGTFADWKKKDKELE